jgi:DNA-binding beta-propeller fold protein YncE
MTQTEHSYSDLVASGVAPKFFPLLHLNRAPVAHPARYRGLRDLYVSDFGGTTTPSGYVERLHNGTYTEKGRLTSSIDGPDGNFIDAAGNFYVANYAGIDIAEFAPHGTTPSFVYNSGMDDPVDVTVDTSGNVYEADYASGGAGFIKEYKQASNKAIHTCAPGVAFEGVAVDTKGDVFVDYNESGAGAIIEYTGGLKGCHATVLGVTLSFAGGMALDSKGDLLVCDQLKPAVEVIDPPYTKVNHTLGSGFTEPFHVTLNKANTFAFVADVGAAKVFIFDYPNGHFVTTLGSADGLTDPSGAVDGPNAVY